MKDSKRLKKIRNKVSLSGEWWRGKTHVLIDMDGTLIDQPGPIFHNLFAVFAFWRLSRVAKLKSVIAATVKTKKILLSRNHGFASNEDAFFETLAQEMKVKRSQVERMVKGFFDSDYPFICMLLHSEPHARRLMDLLHVTNRHSTLATNPVFGAREIELRLQASDLYLHDFDLVTTWDVMKNTKPHQNFFEDTLNRIGVLPENTVMIGNDPYYDLPAHKFGIQTLLVGSRLSIEDIADSLEQAAILEGKSP